MKNGIPKNIILPEIVVGPPNVHNDSKRIMKHHEALGAVVFVFKKGPLPNTIETLYSISAGSPSIGRELIERMPREIQKMKKEIG